MPYGPEIPALNLITTIGFPVPAFNGYWNEFPNEEWTFEFPSSMTRIPQGCTLRVQNDNDESLATSIINVFYRTQYSLETDGAVAISVIPTGGIGGAGTATWLHLEAIFGGPSMDIYIRKTTTALEFRVREGFSGGVWAEDTSASITYDATEHRHWRMRFTGSDVILETAPDCGEYTARLTAPLGVEPRGRLKLFTTVGAGVLDGSTWGVPTFGG